MLNFLLDNTSATLPLKVALIFEDKTYSYAELCELTQCLAASQLIDLPRIRLPEYKVPYQVIFADNLPHGASGKIDRKTLGENALSLDPS